MFRYYDGQGRVMVYGVAFYPVVFCPYTGMALWLGSTDVWLMINICLFTNLFH